MRSALISSTLQRAFIPSVTLARLWQNGTFCRTDLFKLPLVLGQYSGQMHFSKGKFFEKPGIMASTLTGKSTTAELPKLQPLLFSYISLPKYCIAFEVFVEQAVLIQKVCLSPSHYETACIAGEISRQVEQWSHVEIGSTSIPSWLHRSLHMAALQESTRAQNPINYAG